MVSAYVVAPTSTSPGWPRGLQARRGVHDLAGDEQLPGGSDARGRLARLDRRHGPRAARRGRATAGGDASGPGSRGPARTARTASSSWTCGRPNTAITASPMNFSGWPRSARSSSLAASKNPPRTSRARSGSSRCARPVESTRSANRTVTTFRSWVPRVVDTGVPQFGTEAGVLRQGVAAELALHGVQHRGGTDPSASVAAGRLDRHGTHNLRTAAGLPRLVGATSRQRARSCGSGYYKKDPASRA